MAHCKIALYALIAKQSGVYNYILDEDKQDDPCVSDDKGEKVTPSFPYRTDQEHGSRPVSTSTFEMKTSKRQRGREQEADRKACTRSFFYL